MSNEPDIFLRDRAQLQQENADPGPRLLLLLRALQEEGDSDFSAAPTSSPGFEDFTDPDPPVPAASSTNRTTGISVVIVLVIFTFSVFVTLRLVRSWRNKRDAEYMQARSEAADRVLGDMQMVETEELDNELL